MYTSAGGKKRLILYLQPTENQGSSSDQTGYSVECCLLSPISTNGEFTRFNLFSPGRGVRGNLGVEDGGDNGRKGREKQMEGVEDLG